MPVRTASPLARICQASAGVAILLASALALSGCGSARGAPSGGEHARKSSPQASSTRTSVAAEQGSCSEVEDPAPKGPQHIAKPKSVLAPSKTYLVSLETNCGAIEIKLAARRAPRIAASFAYLVKLGFYDELTFHLVLPGCLIQGGDPEGNGSGGPGYVVVEKPPAHIRYTPGTVAMAKDPTQPAGTAGSQFFIVVGKKLDLPPQYALLGHVVKGWSTVKAISHIRTENDTDSGDDSAPARPVVISRALLTVVG